MTLPSECPELNDMWINKEIGKVLFWNGKEWSEKVSND